MWISCLTTLLGALCFSTLAAVSGQSGERECANEDIRLVNGTALEGRVEICLDNQWGTICADNWDVMDTAVVCRQLGFSVEGLQALDGPKGPGPINLDEVSCQGSEQRLGECPFNRIVECSTSRDASVRCQPNFPRSVRTSATDTSVLITWQPPGATLPDHYNITLTHTNNSQFSNQTRTTAIQVLGTTTRLEHDRLLPQQNYSYCISSIYGPLMSSFCHTFQTETLGSTSGSNNAVGILSSVIVVLILLLVLVGIGGLAYPRCIRSRIKDKKYLSSISHFLDERIYLSNNSAYIRSQQPPVPSKETTQAPTDGAPSKKEGSKDEDSGTSYEMMDDAPPPIPDRDRTSMVYEAMEPIHQGEI